MKRTNSGRRSSRRKNKTRGVLPNKVDNFRVCSNVAANTPYTFPQSPTDYVNFVLNFVQFANPAARNSIQTDSMNFVAKC